MGAASDFGVVLAPCVDGDRWSLAVCKPRIRVAARVGDWGYTFGRAEYGPKLISVARVTAKLVGGRV